jgi:hypothetical protein
MKIDSSLIVESKNKKSEDRVSIKRFVLFGFVMYPFWMISILYYDPLKQLLKYDYLATILMFILFSSVNYFFGQKKIKTFKIILFFVVVIIFVAGWASDTHKFYGPDSPYILDILQTLVVYAIFFPIVFFAQFLTWIPFLFKFVYQNRKNLDNLSWE